MHGFFVVFFICTELCDEDDESETDDEENTNDSSHSSDVDNAHIGMITVKMVISTKACVYIIIVTLLSFPKENLFGGILLPTMFKT